MEAQISFQCRAFELPSPCSETGRDCEWQAQRRAKEIEIGYRCEDRLFTPDRQDLEDGACYKQRDRKMNEDRMLRVWRQNCRLEIERPGGNPPSHGRIHFSTRLLCICAPAGQEEFFAQVGVAVATRTTPPPKLDERAQAEFIKKAQELAPKYRTELLKR